MYGMGRGGKGGGPAGNRGERDRAAKGGEIRSWETDGAVGANDSQSVSEVPDCWSHFLFPGSPRRRAGLTD